MNDFAAELSKRLIRHAEFTSYMGQLQSIGAATTLPSKLERNIAALENDVIGKLLYCASVFAQSTSEKHIGIAQTIAFNAMLVCQDDSVMERCSTILTEIGNFPSIKYAESHYGSKPSSLFGMVQRNVVEYLNTVRVHGANIALTDYQKGVWDSLKLGESLAVSAPTSAGKSFLVIEHLCLRAISEAEFTFVYIAPTRALLAEVHMKIKERLASHPDIRVTDIPSYDDTLGQIFILTQERFQVLLSTTSALVDLVIVDEAQNLSDGARGMILQNCVEQCFERNENTHVVMLAPGAEGFRAAVESLGMPHISEVSTTVSPVLQNRIVVSKTPSLNQIEFKLLTEYGSLPIGSMACDRGISSPDSRLAAVALELGSLGGSLVYAKTPTEAAKLAGSLALGINDAGNENDELVAFIKDHIHPDYHLINMVRKGVAFHYGQMPALLREAIENAFRKGSIKFLVCTTTLFQGINLPARNVFLNTPARGKGDSQILDPALLWNFAGRAGRMTKDIVGNVFLVDYYSWSEQPMDKFSKFTIKSALTDSITENINDVLTVLNGSSSPGKPRDDSYRNAIASAGMLITKARQDTIGDFLLRVAPDLDYLESIKVRESALSASKKISLPKSVVDSSWMLNLFALNNLMSFLNQSVKDGVIDDLIPKNPSDLRGGSLTHYKIIFNRIFKHVKGYEGNYGGYVSRIAVRWMEGRPYPVIIKFEMKSKKLQISKRRAQEQLNLSLDSNYKVKTIRDMNPNSVIKDTFDTIEDVVRFQLVQMGKAYIDILTHVLISNGLRRKVAEIFDFSMALELGVSTLTSRSLLELGLSRIAASALQNEIPDSDWDVSKARKALLEFDHTPFKFSRVILEEISKVRVALGGERLVGV